jgi:hypothetical protein
MAPGGAFCRPRSLCSIGSSANKPKTPLGSSVPRVFKHGKVAIGDNRGADFVAPEHFKSLTLGIVKQAEREIAIHSRSGSKLFEQAFALTVPTPDDERSLSERYRVCR